jgi:hypothetical protein
VVNDDLQSAHGGPPADRRRALDAQRTEAIAVSPGVERLNTLPTDLVTL